MVDIRKISNNGNTVGMYLRFEFSNTTRVPFINKSPKPHSQWEYLNKTINYKRFDTQFDMLRLQAKNLVERWSFKR